MLAVIIFLPVGLVAMQPDLGTAALIAASGALLIADGRPVAAHRHACCCCWRWAAAWFGWHFMHDYQRERVLTFLNPQTDPLGAGYHIIQTQIAIGSGGVFGKGWMNGSQAQLEFLPERSTDFIFAVIGEEFGLHRAAAAAGAVPVRRGARGLAGDADQGHLLATAGAGSIALTFFVYVFINAGMVSGLLPVVGVPLPLVSYGGTSVVTLLAGFGILMGAVFASKARRLLMRAVADGCSCMLVVALAAGAELPAAPRTPRGSRRAPRGSASPHLRTPPAQIRRAFELDRFDVSRPEIRSYIDQLVAQGLTRDRLTACSAPPSRSRRSSRP